MRLQSTYRFISLFTLAFLMLVKTAHAQISGCTDPDAVNYNAAATVNDGSCEYNAAFLTPQVRVDPLSSTLNETSALQMAGNYLWTLNDGGGAAAIYRIDTLTNAILQTVTLGGASNVDWEDLAFDGTHFYIGDFGNNANGARTDLRIYKFPLSAIPDHASNISVTIPADKIDVISFTYSDQGTPVATAENTTKFDCEAMIVDGGKIHLFSKNWIDNNTTHYVINSVNAGSHVATPQETLATDFLVTGADKMPGTDLVVLLGYQQALPAYHYMYLLSDYNGGLYFNGNKRKIQLEDASYMGQAEGIALRTSSYGYISNEYIDGDLNGLPITVTPKLLSFTVTEFLPAIVLPLELKQFDVTRSNGANRIRWDFASPVNELQVQHSSDRTSFTTLETYRDALQGSLLHTPESRTSGYRLVWKNGQGAAQYSAIKYVRNSLSQAFANIVLRQNGELLLTRAGTTSDRYSFRLLSTDGKLLAQTAPQQLASGANRLRFQTTLTPHSAVVLEIIHAGEREAILVSVQ